MYVAASCDCCPDGVHSKQTRGSSLKRARPEESATTKPVPMPGTIATEAAAVDSGPPAPDDKAARKLAKRAAKAAAAGLTESEYEASLAAAKERRVEKKAAQKVRPSRNTRSHPMM
jgi:hypothetical protein